jgi:hypothetical protein
MSGDRFRGEIQARVVNLENRHKELLNTLKESDDKLDQIIESLAEQRGKNKAMHLIYGTALSLVAVLSNVSKFFTLPSS